MATHDSHHEIRIEHNLVEDIKNHRGWFTFLGGLFMVLGVLAIAFPWIATLSLELVMGTLFVIAGVAQAVQSFTIPRWKGFAMSLFLATLAFIAGLLMWFYPLAGAMTLATLVMLYFFLAGIVKTSFALWVRPAVGWGWILTSGLLSLGLGVITLIQLVNFLPWILGLLLGIDFIFSGFWMLMLAAKAKQL